MSIEFFLDGKKVFAEAGQTVMADPVSHTAQLNKLITSKRGMQTL